MPVARWGVLASVRLSLYAAGKWDDLQSSSEKIISLWPYYLNTPDLG